jgi:hypothetical protein
MISANPETGMPGTILGLAGYGFSAVPPRGTKPLTASALVQRWGRFWFEPVTRPPVHAGVFLCQIRDQLSLVQLRKSLFERTDGVK